MNDRTRIHDMIINEEYKQEEKWGEQNHDNYYWICILTEEIGEIAKALIENQNEDMEKEIIQTAAVCVSWVDCIKRKGIIYNVSRERHKNISANSNPRE